MRLTHRTERALYAARGVAPTVIYKDAAPTDEATIAEQMRPAKPPKQKRARRAIEEHTLRRRADIYRLIKARPGIRSLSIMEAIPASQQVLHADLKILRDLGLIFKGPSHVSGYYPEPMIEAAE